MQFSLLYLEEEEEEGAQSSAPQTTFSTFLTDFLLENILLHFTVDLSQFQELSSANKLLFYSVNIISFCQPWKNPSIGIFDQNRIILKNYYVKIVA